MSKALIELHLFPSSYFFSLMLKFDLQIEAFENYQKRSFRNRYSILSASGIQNLSIPLVKGKNQNLPIQEVLISYDHDWQDLHFKTLQAAYGKSPYFNFYKDELEFIFNQKTIGLWDWNVQCLQWLCEQFQIAFKFNLTKAYNKDLDKNELDLRNKIKPVNVNLLHQNSYDQLHIYNSKFIGGLSSLDLLFNKGPESILYMNSTELDFESFVK